MFQLVTAVLMVGAQPAIASGIGLDNLPEVFAATCLDGTARVPAGSLTKVGFGNLPSRIRDDLGHPTSAQVWRLNTTGRAYLYVLDYAPGQGMNPKICGLASDEMSIKAAADLLDLRLAGSIVPARRKTTQWLRPEDGYLAIATTAGDFHVVQVNWLTDRDRAEVLKELRPVSH
ncbi:MAG: hypothetical protein ABI770_08280 [Sphingomicrobium sp.]